MYELTVIILKSWKTGILQKIADLKLDTIEKCYVNKFDIGKTLDKFAILDTLKTKMHQNSYKYATRYIKKYKYVNI